MLIYIPSANVAIDTETIAQIVPYEPKSNDEIVSHMENLLNNDTITPEKVVVKSVIILKDNTKITVDGSVQDLFNSITERK